MANALARTLPPWQNKMLGLIDPDFAKAVVAQGLQPKDELWKLAVLLKYEHFQAMQEMIADEEK